jgi:outer membrane protein OmpA-like peptidoglycan-associated protein
MHTFRFILVVPLLLGGAIVLAQSPEEKVQEILAKLDAGESIENMVINLSDINFETGTAKLEPMAESYLEKVVHLLTKAPNIDLFIKGHADITGSDDINRRLSLDRALSVQLYLLEKGIAPARLTAQGFGSEQPVAANNTAEGRALNRRVELEVLRRKEVETIQDIIVLRDRQRIGSRVLDYDSRKVRYQQFTSEDTLTLSAERVDTIYFSDGTFTVFEHAEKNKFNLAEWWSENVHVFKESASFRQGNFVLGLGAGLRNNIGISNDQHQIRIPPLLLIAEMPLGHNLGVGLSAGTMRWQIPEVDDVTYTYYAVSSRVAYHFNLGRKLDVYTGVTLTGRRITKDVAGVSIYRQKIDPGLLLGVRYYLNNSFGFFAEIGDESVAYPKAGLTLKFGN